MLFAFEENTFRLFILSLTTVFFWYLHFVLFYTLWAFLWCFETHHFLFCPYQLLFAQSGLAGEILFTFLPQHTEPSLQVVVNMPTPGSRDISGAPSYPPLFLQSWPLLLSSSTMSLLLLNVMSLLPSTMTLLLLSTKSLLIGTAIILLMLASTSLVLLSLLTSLTLLQGSTFWTGPPPQHCVPLLGGRLLRGLHPLFLMWGKIMEEVTPVLLVVKAIFSVFADRGSAIVFRCTSLKLLKNFSLR